jgi:hypothetical protein
LLEQAQEKDLLNENLALDLTDRTKQIIFCMHDIDFDTFSRVDFANFSDLLTHALHFFKLFLVLDLTDRKK